MTTALYDSDFYAWTEEQAAQLRRAGETRVNLPVDWEAVAEEIEDLGKSRLAAAESFLRLIILHCLKLEYSRLVEPREHWRVEIDTFRAEIDHRLEESPSLKSRIDLDRVYRITRRRGKRQIINAGIDPDDMPPDCPYSLDDLLDEDWWPENRHGLT
ncbi:MAG: DUF29 family protein [Alphaproteobacteria bacterium]|jgi:hypothetical protein|nr:DUF29 family protein [Alphaproteobacteria bacterium]